MTNLLKILNNIEPNGELLDTETALRAMREAVKQACKEQRELCFKEIYGASPKVRAHTTGSLYYQSMSQKEFRDTILNAPEPDIE